MLKKIGLSLGIILIVFLGYVSTRPSFFRYERSGVINAPADKIFPYLSDFKLGGEWSPYEKVDPNLKRNFIGSGTEVGSVMEFEGNSEAGSGRLEMLKIVPNQAVDIKLIMTQPMHVENLIQYSLIPEAEGTRFTWVMSGDGGFMSKLIGVLVDCEKMVGGQFEQGITNLKALVEAKK